MSKVIVYGMLVVGVLGGTAAFTIVYDRGAKQAWPVVAALAVIEATLIAVWVLK